jgi:catechol 2,3-dioxygenase-like lactoylglutathione lyase family enzyme
MSLVKGARIRVLAQISLTTSNASHLASFFERALGFRRLETKRFSGADFERLMGVKGGAKSITLGLGEGVMELLEFDQVGQPYPKDASSSDLIFQHFAIVVTNMDQAYGRLSTLSDWAAISCAGPQRLPEASGGVTAFKFRDPDGHPLELLAFPVGRRPDRWQSRSDGDLYLGIDHSAIGVYDSARSVAFYETLGFRAAARSLNRGAEQDCLDAVNNACVEVTALKLRRATPHIELLCYQSVTHDRSTVLHNNDVAATRLVLEAVWPSPDDESAGRPRSMTDPDGHHLMIVPQSVGDATARKASTPHGHTGSAPVSVKSESTP